MRLRCNVSDGLIASQRCATFRRDTRGEVLVDASQLDGEWLEVREVMREADRVLVELPAESSAGSWRVWVRPEDVKP